MLMQAAQEGVESPSLMELFKTQLDTGWQMQSCVFKEPQPAGNDQGHRSGHAGKSPRSLW